MILWCNFRNSSILSTKPKAAALAISESPLSRTRIRSHTSFIQPPKPISPLSPLFSSRTLIQQFSDRPRTRHLQPHVSPVSYRNPEAALSFSTACLLRSKNNPRQWPSDRAGPSSTGRTEQDVNSKPAQNPNSSTVNDAPNQESKTQQTTHQDEVSNTSTSSPSETSEHFAPGHGQPQNTSAETPSNQPLPDLTQGIPPTFEHEYRDGYRSAKREESETTDLDLTEETTREKGEEDFSREEYVSSIERRRNAVAKYLYITAFAMIAAGAVSLGQDWRDAEEEKRHPEAPNGWHPWNFYLRIRARIAEMMGYYTEPTFPKLLPNLDSSFGMPPYTLVLSLEDLLVHSEWNRQSGWDVAKRPGVDYFIRYLSQYYELVIFTTVPSMYAEMVIKKLDPYQIVMFPLFREATRYMKGEHVKDLSYLNRDLSKTLIIDTNSAHTQLQPENAIILPKWNGKARDENTGDLIAMIPFLEYIASMSLEDVRKVLKSYEGTHIPTEFQKREAKAREAFNKRLEEEKSKRGGMKSVSGGLSGLLGMKYSSQVGGGMQIPGEPSISEGLAQGKMLSDQIRERGQKQYQELERQINEHGKQWLEEMEREQKKAIEESMKSVQSGVTGWPGSFVNWLTGDGKQQNGGDFDAQKGSEPQSQRASTIPQGDPRDKDEDEKKKQKKKWWQIM